MKLLPIMMSFRVGDPRVPIGTPVVERPCDRCSHAVVITPASDDLRQERNLTLICRQCLKPEEARKLGGLYVSQAQANETMKYQAGQN